MASSDDISNCLEDSDDDSYSDGSLPLPSPAMGGPIDIPTAERYIVRIPTPPKSQLSSNSLPVAQEACRDVMVYQQRECENVNPRYPPRDDGTGVNNVAPSDMLQTNTVKREFDRLTCKACKRETIRFSQRKCGHAVCGFCLPHFVGLPCKVCGQLVLEIQQIDPHSYSVIVSQQMESETLNLQYSPIGVSNGVNNVAQPDMLHANHVNREFDRLTCRACKRDTNRFAQKKCGHAVCGSCVPNTEGLPCKVCGQLVLDIQQIDPHNYNNDYPTCI